MTPRPESARFQRFLTDLASRQGGSRSRSAAAATRRTRAVRLAGVSRPRRSGRSASAASSDVDSAHPKGYQDKDGNTLFVETDPDGTKRSTVVEIHIGKKEEANEAEWEKIRASVNAIDADQIVDPEGRLDEHGKPLTIPNPYNVVVSA